MSIRFYNHIQLFSEAFSNCIHVILQVFLSATFLKTQDEPDYIVRVVIDFFPIPYFTFHTANTSAFTFLANSRASILSLIDVFTIPAMCSIRFESFAIGIINSFKRSPKELIMSCEKVFAKIWGVSRVLCKSIQ